MYVSIFYASRETIVGISPEDFVLRNVPIWLTRMPTPSGIYRGVCWVGPGSSGQNLRTGQESRITLKLDMASLLYHQLWEGMIAPSAGFSDSAFP